jgi:hypothetical protein
MTKSRVVCAAVAILGAAVWSSASQQQSLSGAPAKPKVEIVQTMGCVEYRAAGGGQWWLTHAAEPTVSREGVFTTRDIDLSKETTQGTRAFRLIGHAEYLDAQGLLRTQQRKDFTTPEQVNATGSLRDGRTVLLKGLLVPGAEERINLLQVAPLAETCS